MTNKKIYKIMKITTALFLVCFLSLSVGCVNTNNNIFNHNYTDNSVINYLNSKYPNEGEFEVYEKIGPGLDADYTEYHCYSNKSSDKNFVVYKNSDGSYQDNYYSVLIYDDYKNKLDSVLSKYFDDYKVYIRFTSNFFDDDVVDADKFDYYLHNDPQQFFADYFIFVSEDDTEKLVSLDTSKLNRELQGEFVNYFISINIVDDNVFNSDTLLNENTYLSVEKTKVYSETIK